MPLQVAQYIGEMCRYVLAVPPRPEDRQHGVRLMVGNGMKPAIWKAFVDRFNIPNVVEVYGSTEGNANICEEMRSWRMLVYHLQIFNQFYFFF